MGIRICPICDAKLNHSSFCRGCKRFVKAKEISRDFYLNERRPGNSYDDIQKMSKQWDIERNTKTLQYQTTKTKTSQYQTTKTKTSQATTVQGDSWKKAQTKRNSNVNKSVGVVITIVVAFFIGAAQQLADSFHDVFDNTTEYNVDTVDYYDDIADIIDDGNNDGYDNNDIDYEMYDFGNYDNTANEDIAINDEEAGLDGNACTSYGHYSGIDALEFLNNIVEYENTKGMLSLNKNMGYKNLSRYTINDQEYTCYEICDVLATTGLGRDGIATYYDSNTYEIHSIYLWASKNELVDGTMIYSMLDCVVENICDDNLDKEIDNIISHIDELISLNDVSGEDKTVNIHIGEWNITIGRSTKGLYVYLNIDN